MSKTILVTAGPVYASIDDNKIVSNRSRGIWATELARHLHGLGYKIILSVPDIMRDAITTRLGFVHEITDDFAVITHNGYERYRSDCVALAPKVDVAIMAAAVLNYIPETTFKGKLPTDKERISIDFIRSPKVINEMKKANPKMTLIGCKLLFSNDYDKLVEAAYDVVLNAKCNAVIANDGIIGLKTKYVIHQDKTVITFNNDFDGLYHWLTGLINDDHYRTESIGYPAKGSPEARAMFDRIVDIYAPKWMRRATDSPFVFGSIAVRDGDRYLVSPREKGWEFTSDSAVLVTKVEDLIVYTLGRKATLNAPLLIRMIEKFPGCPGVVHIHAHPHNVGLVAFNELPYFPPGTARDNERDIPGHVNFITGHGVVASTTPSGNIIGSRLPSP